MSDPRRRRYNKVKNVEKRPPITLARREDNPAAEPKILLKTRWNEDGTSDGVASGSTGANAASGSVSAPLKTVIVTRSSGTSAASAQSTSHNAATISPVTVATRASSAAATEQSEATATSSAASSNSSAPLVEPVPQMTRPATVVSSTGIVNTNVRKMLDKTNNDFLVVGVVGTQGVGKSTIVNLLANEQHDYDYYQHVFVDEDAVFPTKLKLHKCSARSRTESTHMFITSHRMILLDSPPVLCNSYKKDMTTNEMDDLRHIISFLSVCHLLIVVQDDYINMNFLRLLQLAELMKPIHDNKQFNADYLPNLLFVKNRAKRLDYEHDSKQRLDEMLTAFFRDTQLRIYAGQTTTGAQQQLRKKKPTTAATVGASAMSSASVPLRINSFLLPEVTSGNRTPYHEPLCNIVQELRNLVFTTPRGEMYADANEFTESVWFDLLAKVAQDTKHFFFNTYENIQRRHLDLNAATAPAASGVSDASGASGSVTNIKEPRDSWRD